MITSGVSVLELRGVCQAAGAGAPLLEITLGIAPGALTLLRGAPGSGHRALWRLIGLLDAPTAGQILLQGEASEYWSESQRADDRARRCAFLYAAPFLLPSLTVIENVAMPLFKRTPELSATAAADRAAALLAFVQLSGREQLPAGELTFAEQYAVALARALANEPTLLLVEDLDDALEGEPLHHTASLLRSAAQERNLAVIATVTPAFTAASADRLFDLQAGRLVGSSAMAAPVRVDS